MSPDTEVYALRYATMRGRKASEVYYRYEMYGIEDRVLDMDCYFWVVRRGDSVTLLDCGWNRVTGLPTIGRYAQITVDQRDPVMLLAQLGIKPQDVGTVVVSHMHFDHVGNLDLFPQAELVMARKEYETWTGPLAGNPVLSLSIRPEEVTVARGFEAAGRLRLVEDRTDVAPGIVATPVGGHTPGQLLLEVETGSGRVILASDAVHYHEEMNEDRPFYHFSDLVATLETYELLRQESAVPGTRIVSGHDPVEMDRYAAVGDHIVDLTKPLD